jgi:hypothetical protein
MLGMFDHHQTTRKHEGVNYIKKKLVLVLLSVFRNLCYAVQKFIVM